MTRVIADPTVSLQAQPPRSKTVREDAAPLRDDFSALVDDIRPRPSEPARSHASDKPERPRAADRRRDEATTVSSDPPPSHDPSPDAATVPVTAAKTSQAGGTESDSPGTKADAAPEASPDAPAADAAATPQAVILIAPQAIASPGEPGPLSIAAAALAATAATVDAASPSATIAAATETAVIAASTTAVPAPKPTIKSAAKVGPDATTDVPTSDAIASDAAPRAQGVQPVQPAPAHAVKSEAANADTNAPAAAHEHRAAATAQTPATDIGAPTFAPAQPVLHNASAAIAATPQLNVVASQTEAVPLGGLAMQIAATAMSGKTSFDIRLDPAELGRIDVRLDVDRHGNVTSHLTVEKPETLAMLRQDAPQLQRALNDAGLQTSDKGLQFSLSDQSLTGRNNNSNGNDDNKRTMHRLVIAEDDNLSAATAGRSYGRMLASSSGVDIQI